MRLADTTWFLLYSAAEDPNQYQLPGWMAQITISQVLAFVFALLFLAYVVRSVWHFFKPLADFAIDWRGEPARDGVPAHPGIMSRMGTVEESIAKLSDLTLDSNRRLERIESQLHPNGGSTMRDSLDRVEKSVAAQQDDES